MSSSTAVRARLVGSLAVAAALGLSSLSTFPAFAQPAPENVGATCPGIRFDLSNPSPGSMLSPGALIVEGVALDTRAAGTAGVDHVDFFLGSREQGGQSVGLAVPMGAGGPFGPGSFETTLQLPNIVGGRDLVAYAHSDVTGQESVISVPVVIGQNPTVAGVTSVNGSASPSLSEGCIGATTQATSAPSTTTTAATAPSTPAPVTSTAVAPGSSITLEVGNPSSGDSVKVGGDLIQGIAWDAASTSGPGIDRVDIFLDNREAGGVHLGTATVGLPTDPRAWATMVSFPNMLGGHTLFVYAHSSVTDQESVVQIPITLVP